MTRASWERIEALYHAARNCAAADRATYLAEICGGDDDLRQQLEALIAQESFGGGFAEPPHRSDDSSKHQHGQTQMAEVQPPAWIGRQIGPYQVEALLGAGAMGEVYRARDVRLGRHVAVKVMGPAVVDDPDRIARFEREARALASLNHPNIAIIHGIEESRGARVIVMELVDGETVAARLTRRGGLALQEAISLAQQIADALEAAHDKGIIHRDLKPANIKVTPTGMVKVLDFGLAKIELEDRGSETSATLSHARTTDGMIIGTAPYMSPEQARGLAVDKRADIWAFGAVVFELLTGTRAFAGRTTSDVLAKILEGEPDWAALPSTTPPALTRLIRVCLHKEPRQRLRDIGEARRQLDELIAGEPGDTVVPVGPVDRHRGPLAIGAVLLLLAIAAGVFSGLRARSAATVGTGVPSSLETFQITQLTTSGRALRPAISPDGNYVVYVEQDGERSSLWVRQTATASGVQIVAEDPAVSILGATVTPDGAFVDFLRFRKTAGFAELWRVPLLGGTAKRLIDHCDSAIGWAPDGQHMAVLRREEGATVLVISDANGGSERELARRFQPSGFATWTIPQTPVVRPAWSFDGKTIAVPGFSAASDGTLLPHLVFISVADGSERSIPLPAFTPSGAAWLDPRSLVSSHPQETYGPAQLWRVEYPAGQVSRLTNDLNHYDGVSLSTDRSMLVTARNDRRVGIWVGDGAATRGAELVPPVSVLGPSEVTWAGDRVLHTATVAGRPSIASVAADGTSEQIVAGGLSPAATSDGTAIVYESSEDGDRGGLWKVDGEGRHAMRLVAGNVSTPVVTPDDQNVIFISDRSGPQSPWIVSLRGDGQPRQLINEHVIALDVSPDGRWLAFRGSSGSWVVCDFPTCIDRRAMSGQHSVLRGILSKGKWTPDGRAFAYTDPTTRADLWVQPLDGTPAHQLTHFAEPRVIADFSWSHDGKRLAIARTTVANDIVLLKGLKMEPR